MSTKGLTPQYIKELLLQAQLLSDYRFADGDSDGTSTAARRLIVDSRSATAEPGTVFAALRTDVADGHNYLPEVYAAGVRMFIVEHMPAETMPMACVFVVSSVPEALKCLSGTVAATSSACNFIVTGSYGKTQVKELMFRALATADDVVRSPRSHNSFIGVAMAQFENNIDRHDNIITEIGIDGPGQAKNVLALVPRADIAVITPITDEHDAAFPGGHREKIAEKIALTANCHTIVYADVDADLRTMLADEATRRADAGNPVRLVPVTEHDACPTIFHALAGAATGIDVSGLSLISTRIDIRESTADNILLIDSFTHDIASLRESLDFMRRHATPVRKNVVIVGDILTTAGGDTVSADTVATIARRYDIDRIIDYRDSAALEAIERGEGITDAQILFFGGDELKPFLSALESADHDTSLEVNLDAVAHNFNYYRRLAGAGTGIIAMVKASAYGTGAVEIGRLLQSRGAACLAVAVVDEGISLRRAGITMPIMVMNPMTNRYQALFANRLEPAVFSINELRTLIAEAERYGARRYPVHIKLDTGMHRVGFIDESLDELCDILATTDALKVQSVFTHLATADCPDMNDYTQSQIDAYYRMADRLAARLPRFRRHLLNTAGIMRFAGCGPYDMCRVGIGLYGISPLPAEYPHDLQPVATLRSTIISLKHWPAGTPIGYGCKGRTAGADSLIATVPIGYADGLNRHLSRGAASFLIGGRLCPTIGNICMDQCMVDVTAVPDVAVGDTVEIFGNNIAVETLADTLGTIPYEILTSVSPRVRRTYFTRF